MVLTALQMTPKRNQLIEFSMPYLETGTTIVVSLRKGAISPTAVLEPYDYPSWCLILVFSVHSIGASIFIFEWLSPWGLDQGNTPMREHAFSLFRSFWLIWAMLFGASVSADNPRGCASRFLANVWALFALVFLASYTANLAAFMITKEVYYDLSGIKDWRLTNPHSHKPPFKFATVPNGSTEENLRQNHPEMFSYMKKYNQPSVREAVKALKKGSVTLVNGCPRHAACTVCML
ncbi:glutamate receptor ionotropic, NMDA 2D-like [Mizuhopecten yessoensis]|uniref:glutamate receptor ionotropic, NMDA 2D-like n=2 Tax=Mizuhopecten yessoensis TaxID=6573 RepID=UPI000B45A0EF|nr:glutamate receptor ionotropic, NMDA 2D-like [Mizuhopecten yessoensis]